ncbi:hypothetical protein NCTC12673_gp115 [Campylobacter phage NCTC12673]|uniref:Uncharacterized protein n=3 Tax=Fletchervirus TaxID=1636618 RepID=F4YAD7_9CAUD|nr:hypothetical protein NCTC12673_gp115 [Campylobacter phage NCTC12673]AEA86459.1 hypothetical protein [Campylobacter phage NCTC12673]
MTICYQYCYSQWNNSCLILMVFIINPIKINKGFIMLEYGSSSIKDIIDNSTKLLTSNLEWTVGTGGGQVRRLANCYQ